MKALSSSYCLNIEENESRTKVDCEPKRSPWIPSIPRNDPKLEERPEKCSVILNPTTRGSSNTVIHCQNIASVEMTATTVCKVLQLPVYSMHAAPILSTVYGDLFARKKYFFCALIFLLDQLMIVKRGIDVQLVSLPKSSTIGHMVDFQISPPFGQLSHPPSLKIPAVTS